MPTLTAGLPASRLVRVFVAFLLGAVVLVVPSEVRAAAPGFIDFDLPVSSIGEGDAGSTSHPVAVALTVPGGDVLDFAVSVDVVVTGGSATGTDDFSIPVATVTFPAGSSDGTMPLNISIVGDILDEANETIELGLANLTTTGATIISGQTTHVVTINDDDDTFSVAFQNSTSNFSELNAGSTPRNVVVVLSTPVPLSRARTVQVALNTGSSTADGSDFSFTSPATVTFPASSVSGTPRNVAVSVNGDLTPEPNETVVLALQNASTGGSIVGTSQHTLTILNDDLDAFSFAFTTAASAFPEGDSGSVARLVTVQLTTATPLVAAQSVQVELRAGGTATDTVDFSFLSPTTVNFPAGSANGTTRNATVSVNGDTADELNETVLLGLVNPSTGGLVLGTTQHTLTITDDDDTFSAAFSLAASAQVEGDTGSAPATVDVVLTSAVPLTQARTVEVALDTGSSTALLGSDFSFTSPATVTFPAGSADGATQAVPGLSILGDTVGELNESVVLTLQNASLGGSIGSTSTHTLSITDDEDTFTVAFSTGTSSQAEGTTGTIGKAVTVVLTTVGALSQPRTVEVVQLGGTAKVVPPTPPPAVGDDATFTSPTLLTFPIGSVTGATQNATVTVIGDPFEEASETVILGLQSVSIGGTLGAIAVHTLTIVDDDNVAPSITTMNTVDASGTPAVEFRTGQPTKVKGTFTDVGLADAHSILVDWGDGTPSAAVPLSPVGARAFEAAHTFTSPGFFTVSATVSDADGGISSVMQRFVVVTGAALSPVNTTGLVDPSQGRWYLYNDSGGLLTSFFFGNPGDYPIMGDWDCDGIETPGMYRQSDGYVYLRNTNTQGPGDIKFFFGNPGDVPIAGDFNGDGCGTVSIYRPSSQTFYIINTLGENDGGLGAAEFSYVFGDPGDKPFVGDFDGDGVETVGLHRESTGLVYFRNSHTQGNADSQFIFGDPGDRLIAGDWNANGVFTPALFRPSSSTMFFRYTNTQGNADNQFVPSPVGSTWLPVSGRTK